MKTYLILGAAGWIGDRVVRTLSNDAGARVFACWHRSPIALPVGSNVLPVRADIRDVNELARLIAEVRPQIVIHAAAAISARATPEVIAEMGATNLIGTANLVRTCQANRVRRIVFCSSVSVYGDESPIGGFSEASPLLPATPYGLSKLGAELLLREATSGSELECIALRLGGVHGSGRDTGVIATFCRQARRNEPLQISSPQVVFNYLFIDDAIQAIGCAAHLPVPRQFNIYNVAGRTSISIEDLAHKIVKKMCSSSEVNVAEPLCTKYRVLNTSKIAAELGYVPRSLDEALDAYLEQRRP